MKHAFPSAWRRGVYEAIAQRRDMRAFEPDPIPPETLARVLGAAHQAGSVGFMQPWSFIVVGDLETRRAIRAHVERERLRAAEAFTGARRAQYLSYKLEGILDAPLNVCVTCDRERNGPAVLGRHTIRDTDVYSTCGAVQNLWLAARAEGLGVGWVSVLEPAALRRILGIPEHVLPVAYLCIGAVREFPERPVLESTGWLPRLALSQVVFENRWGAAPGAELGAALEPAPPRAPAPEPPARGQLVVYTGHGKGKTTAALGVVFRALGRGLPCAVVQFIKGKWTTGERLHAETLPELEFHVMGRGFSWLSDDLSRDRRAAEEAWEKARALVREGRHAIVVLDELTYCLHYGFIALEDVLETLRARPPAMHVIVTGRNAPEALLEEADLVTEMRAHKHPFERGLRAQIGLDY